jgi:aldose sugar dehydrogenase
VVAVASATDQKLSLIDPAAAKVSKTLDVESPVGSMALAPNGQTAWVFSSKPGESDFLIVDLAKGERTDSKRLRDNPGAAAFSSDGRRAYVALGGGNSSPPVPSSIVFLNTRNLDDFGHVEVGAQTQGVQIRRRVVALTVVPGEPQDVLYAAAQASGAVWAMDAGSGQLLEEIEVGGGPSVLLSDPGRRRLYVLTDTTNQVIAIDTTSRRVVHRLPLPGRPTGGAIGPDGTLYVATGDNDQLWPIAPELTRLGTPIEAGRQPAGVAVSLDGTRVYVASRGDNSLAVIDARSNEVVSRIAVVKDPRDVLVAPGRAPAGSKPTPTPTAVTNPTATPTVVPTRTPLPEGATPPEHMPADAISTTFVPEAAMPVAMTFAPDGRLFYNELKSGKIRIVQNGRLLPEPFYEFKVAGQPETGLLGLALDPDFERNRYVYVFYTSVADGQENGGTNGPNRVVRLTDVANTGTELTAILDNLPSAAIHNAGTLRFGPDGKLYVSLGDTDKGSNAQDLGTLAGKILRVNPDGTIPNDNPFVGVDGKQPAIWAYGFRNPFSFDFDPVSGALMETENGPGDNDELNMIVKGGNHGWPPSGYTSKRGDVDPIAVMNPPIGPTGMAFYVGNQVPEWQNDWFYCNYHQSQLRRVRLAPESRDRVVFEQVVKNGCSLGVVNGPDGALYYAGLKSISRIHSATATNLLEAAQPQAAAPQAGLSPAAVAQASPTPTPEPLPAGTREEDRDVNLSLSEWAIQPSRAKVPAGKIRFVSENIGATAHSIQIVGQGIDVTSDNFGSGSSRALTLVLPPGEYQLICPIPGHERQGMITAFNVVGP